MVKLFKWFVVLTLVVGVALLAFRAYQSTGGPPLQPWHTFVPVELTAAELDRSDWARYLAQEETIMASVRAQVTDKLDPAVQVSTNRYYEESPVYSPKFQHDWNRSYVMEPDGVPKGAVVLLHGLTDSPYSLRHIAQRYRDQGFVAIGIRLPGHGTVPAGLTSAGWEDWMAATRLAVREARRRVSAPAPLHLVGFSNGGALAMKYSLDALDDPSLPRADRIVLLTPMIGITRFARFAGLAGLPALLPPFSNAAWLSIIPEFNPFKYNSFPVHGARQSYLLTDALQAQLQRVARAGRQGGLPPVLTFQSVIDFTVSTPAILSALYANLPDNGSEIVLFDVNRTLKFSPLLRPSSYVAVERLAPTTPQPYTFTVITTAGEGSDAVVERTVPPGDLEAKVRPLGLSYPPGIYSLSHLSIPIPVDDPLYGTRPDPSTRLDYGFSLGALDARGERGALIVDQDYLTRLSSNPFYPYVVARIDEGITRPSRASGRDIAATGSPGVPVRAEAVLSTLLPPDNEGQAFAGP
jgi:alpha-beta hydrolase superfamily lysophospholipase